MKLCIVSDGGFFSTYGGGQVYVRNLVDGFIQRKDIIGIQLFVISCQANGESVKKTSYKGISVYECETKDNIREILNKERPDVVHANGNYQDVTHVCKELGIKSIITIHDSRWTCPNVTYLNPKEQLCNERTSIKQCLRCELGRIRGGKFAYPIMRLIPENQYLSIGHKLENKPFLFYITPVGEAALKVKQKMDYWSDIIDSADAVIELSNRMAEMGLKNGLPQNKLRLIPNGIPAPCTPNPFPNTSGTIHFFFTGRICYSKGVHVLLKAFHKIPNQNIQLHIIGGGDKYKQQLIKTYHKDTRIIWHDEVPHNEINNLIQNYHVMIHPSIAAEACPLSIAEALSLGKFIIATRCGGPADLVSEGINGTIVPPNNEEALHSAIIHYINNPISPKEILYNTLDMHINQLMYAYKQL